MYGLLFHFVLRHFDPEAAHQLAKRALRMVRATAPGRVLLARWAGQPDPSLRVQALGLSLLAVGCVMLVGNLWMLRRTLRKESGDGGHSPPY